MMIHTILTVIKESAQYLIPFATIVLTYIIGRIQSIHDDKQNAYREAYEEFYLPFISLLYESQIWESGFAKLPRETREKLFRIITSNIKYMNRATLESVDVLFGHYDAICTKELFDTDSLITYARMDEIFDDITNNVLCQATQLAHKLHQPPIGETALTLYFEYQKVRRTQH